MGETLKERLDRLSKAASKAHSLSASIRAAHEFLDVLSSAYRSGDMIPRDEITPQMAAEVLLGHFTSDDCETDFKPAWAAFRKCLWEHDGSIYSAMTSFLRALTAIKEIKDE